MYFLCTFTIFYYLLLFLLCYTTINVVLIYNCEGTEQLPSFYLAIQSGESYE